MVARGFGVGPIVFSILMWLSGRPPEIEPHTATTFTVNSAGNASDASPGDAVCDDGAGNCTLRAAIEESNANAGTDTIQFAIGTGAQTISVPAALPSVFADVIIDGTTQPGYAGVPLIEIDGNGGAFTGLVIVNGTTLRALLINRFDNGVSVSGTGNTIENCIIGTDASGTQNRGNATDGIAVYASDNTIRNNTIAFNGMDGVGIYDGANFAYPTFTGLTLGQTLTVPSINFTDDCQAFHHASGSPIVDYSGSPFHENFGMRLTATLSIPMSGLYNFNFTQLDDWGRLAIDSVEYINVNGVDPDRDADVMLSAGDHTFEIDFWEGGGAATLLFTVSGPGTATFSYSGNPGLYAELYQGRIASEMNTISQNSIHDNAAQGIALSCCCIDTNDDPDIDIGPNTFLNFPLFTSATQNGGTTFSLAGTAPPNATVEIFGSTNDVSGFGEGKFYAGTTTADGSGNFGVTLNIPWEYYSVTATATDAIGNTSEFSPNFLIHPVDIPVTNTADSGPGSFRAAIDASNADGIPSTITFDPSLTGGSILLSTPLPALTDPFTAIHGDTNNDCVPDVEIHGSGVLSTGLTILSHFNTIRGLAINRFAVETIAIDGPGAHDNMLVCNHLGLGIDGMTVFAPPQFGVVVRNGANANSIGINGSPNFIAGISTDGVWIDGSSNNTVTGNTIGLTKSGIAEPASSGVLLTNALVTSIHGNRIVASGPGIEVNNGNNTTITANTIGWPAGSTPIGDGIFVQNNATQTAIGGNTSALANVLENNGGAGIRVVAADGVTIRWNSISSNGGLGIDLDGDGVSPNDSNGDPDAGANENLNFPILTRAVSNGSFTQVDGFLDSANGNYDIELYASTARDPSGYGEGTTRVFATTIPTGPFTITLPSLPIGTFLTALTCDGSNTSEFSLAKEISGPPLAATELIADPVASGGIELRWRDPQASETGLRIERQQFSSWTTLTNVGPDVTTYLDSTASPGSTHWYRIVATSAAGDAPPSNVATATAFNTSPLETCRTEIGAQHQRAISPSVAFDGTNWAMAWADERNGREADIFFQRLNADGTPNGAAVQITNDDVPSTHPTLVWNGTSYGLLWRDHLRAADGQPVVQLSFALLDSTGAKIRGDLRVTSANPGADPDGATPLIWDGTTWGIFTSEDTKIVFYRLDADGDVIVDGALLTGTVEPKQHVSATFNGSEYGVTWAERWGVSNSSIRFARVQPDGNVIWPIHYVTGMGSPAPAGTSIVVDGSGWAIAWAGAYGGRNIIELARLDANGDVIHGPVRLSDDDAGPVMPNDVAPKLFLKPGGGFIVYMTAGFYGSLEKEIGRVEADATGDRVGTRITISSDVAFSSTTPAAAFDGTSFLVAWNDTHLGSAEIADAIVSTAGVPGTIHDITSGHSGELGASLPVVIPLQNGFVSLWSESFPSGNAIHARIHQPGGGFIDRRPLGGGNPARRPAALPNAGEFAVVWTDRTSGGVHFDRFDLNGDSLMAGGVRIADADVERGAAFDFNGEEWGIVWVSPSNQLLFQRMGYVTPIGVPTVVGDANGADNDADPQIEWLGGGWAVVWGRDDYLWYARLDPAGALIVPDIRITGPPSDQIDFDFVRGGPHLGIAFAENLDNLINPGVDIFFTTLDANGFKQFTPVAVASTPHPDRFPSMNFDGTNFRIVYPDVATGIREIEVTPQGAIVANRFLGNHAEGEIATAFDGATTAMAWVHNGDVLFQTTECLTDTTPPPCVPLNATFSSGAVQLSWPLANDAESGILAYHLYRDGELLTELTPSTSSYTDGGFTPAAVHSYELRPYNGAYLEASGCTAVDVTAGILVMPVTLPNARVSSGYNQLITASQGTSPYTFAVTSGGPPPGIALATNGSLSGSPTSSGLFTFTVTATDNASATGARTYQLRVCNAASLMPTVLPDPIASAPYTQTITLIGGGGPHTFSVTSGALPPGLTLASNGALTGTPATLGAYTFTITALQSSSCATSQSYSLSVISGKAPTDVRAEAQSQTSIVVSWTRPQRGETGFRVERSFDGGSNWGSVNIVGADVNSHLDQPLNPQQVVHYRIVALYPTDSATSAMAAAMTWPQGPTNICSQQIGPYHPAAQYMSVAHNGTQWAAAWSDRRDGKLEDIYFQLLDDTTGAPVGSPLLVTQTDMMTRFPVLRWNGTHFGLLYSEHMRDEAGNVGSTYNFALLDSSGSLLRTGAVLWPGTTGGFLHSSLNLPFAWDGTGWGVFDTSTNETSPSDVYYYRLTPNGDLNGARVKLTNTPGFEIEVAVAWNGSEYGLTWVGIEGTVYKLWFARMQANGTLIGTPQLVDQGAPGEWLYSTNLLWNAGEWALVWTHENDSEAITRLRLFEPDGTPKTAVTRLSDDLVDPNDPPVDNFPNIAPKSGGGYFVFCASLVPSGDRDASRLEADAAGNRVGTRVFLTPTNDNAGTGYPHVATDGTRFLLGLEALSPSGVEASTMLLDAAGSVTNGPTLLTSGHTGGNSSGPPLIVAMGADFGAIWNETDAVGSQLFAKFYNGGGALVQTRYPLLPSMQINNRFSATGTGHGFALTWRDNSDGAIRFRRFDNIGNPFPGEVILANGSQPAVAWNGEHFGIAFLAGGLRFQRVASDATLVGPQVYVGPASGLQPSIRWVDRGWAIVWRSAANLWFALLDRNGAFIVAPQQITFTSTQPSQPQMAWSGFRLGLVWRDMRGGDPPGFDLWFTALKLDGTKAFNEFAIVSTPNTDNTPAIYWDQDRFRIVYADGNGGTREIAVQSDGTLLPGYRIYQNRNNAMSIAFNGVTLGMLFNSLLNLTIQTNACFSDATAPPCPNPMATFDGTKTHITWPVVFDSQSGIGGYNVYRDGIQIAELLGTTTSFDDYGFVSGTAHVYEVRAVNRALIESTGCPTRTVTAGVSVNPASLPNGTVGNAYSTTVSGTGGTAPYTFAVTAGVLPPNTALNGTTGALTGPLTSSGLFDFTITATDALAQTGARAYTVRVCNAMGLYPTVLADGLLGNAYSQTVVASGATGAATFTLTSGTLPAGLTLDATGWIHGTPTALGTSNFTVSATDSIGCSAARSFTIAMQSGSAVRNLSAMALGTSSIGLEWTDPQRNETAFRIERSLDLGTTWTPIANVGANTTTYTDPSLSAATAYSYRIVAATPSGDAPASNAATAMTWPSTAAKTCIQQVSPYHSFARSPSVVRAGSQWAMSYYDRKDGENEEIWFTFLDANGAATGTPLRITNSHSQSTRAMMQWNGSNIGMIYTEGLRGPNGEFESFYRFALIDATGSIVRRDVRIPSPTGFTSGNVDPQFVWDGSAWAFIESHFTETGQTDLLFYRLDEDGDPIVGPIPLTNHPDHEFGQAIAWNGSEYGVVWIRGNTDAQTIQFQRFTSGGAAIGSPVTVAPFGAVVGGLPDVVASPSGWAVTWSESPDDDSLVVMMRRLDASGVLLGPATRISDDWDLNGFTPADMRPVDDRVYDTFALPSGGYVVFSQSVSPGHTEVGMLRADASGNRIGARTILSPNDSFVSGTARAAFDGTNFLVAFNEGRLGTQELASVIVDSSGATVAGPTDLTSGHSVGNSFGFVSSSSQQLAGVGAGFAAVWTEPVPGDTRIYAKIFDGTGALSATKFPLTIRGVRGRPGVVGVATTFAVAWRDPSNNIAFCRYDASGNPLMSEATPVTGASGGSPVLVGFDGENYAIAWVQASRINFQRVSPAGAAIGTRATLEPQILNNQLVQMAWTGSGWAFAYAFSNDIYYMLVDTAGAVIVAPVRVSFTPDETKQQGLAIAWNGDALGVAFGAFSTAAKGKFTVVGLDGIKQFDEVTIAEGVLNTTVQSLRWAGDRFRLTYISGADGTLRELDLSTSGAFLGASRMIANRGGNAATVWNGATTGVLWFQLSELYFETTACLADATPPPCPDVSATHDASGVTLTWPAVADAESGIYRYLIYRDGNMVGETATTSFLDASVRLSEQPSYRVTSLNGAFDESPSCSTFALLASPSSLLATASSSSQVQLAWNIVLNATEYHVERSSDGVTFTPIGTAPTNAYSDATAVSGTSYLYRVRAGDAQQTSAPSNADLATAILFTDDPLVIGVTIAKSVHLSEVRDAVDAVRTLAALPAATYTNSGAPGTVIQAIDLQELRNALDPALAALGITPPSYDEPIMAGVLLKSLHMQEVRNAVK